MSKIKIELQGLGNVIEDLKQTKTYCRCTECINHIGWRGRKLHSMAEKCVLDDVTLSDQGECEQHQIEPTPDLDKPVEDAYKVTGPALEAFQRAADLLVQVGSESEYDQSVDRYSISQKLFNEIHQQIFGPEDDPGD